MRCRDEVHAAVTPLRYADVYDAIYSAKNYSSEAATVLELIGNVTSVLDVGCGTGLHAHALAKQGVRVTGIDIDPAMVVVAEANVVDTTPRPTFLHSGISGAPMGPFDAAVSLFHVVNYVEDMMSLATMFREIAMRLSNGGRFVFDAWNGLAALIDPPTVKEQTRAWKDLELRIRTTPTLDSWNQSVRLDVEIRVSRGAREADQTIHHTFHHRLWTPRELRELLDTAGFVVHRVGTWSRPAESAGLCDWKLLFTAVRA
jgi:SAM-dependent methyltransferase